MHVFGPKFIERLKRQKGNYRLCFLKTNNKYTRIVQNNSRDYG